MLPPIGITAPLPPPPVGETSSIRTRESSRDTGPGSYELSRRRTLGWNAPLETAENPEKPNGTARGTENQREEESARPRVPATEMAFMMPVVKNEWDIYKTNRHRRSSECSNPQACRSRKVSAPDHGRGERGERGERGGWRKAGRSLTVPRLGNSTKRISRVVDVSSCFASCALFFSNIVRT